MRSSGWAQHMWAQHMWAQHRWAQRNCRRQVQHRQAGDSCKMQHTLGLSTHMPVQNIHMGTVRHKLELVPRKLEHIGAGLCK